MSTGADCIFIEVEPSKWKYKIQQWPYGDWPEYDVHGPFDSFSKALSHLDAYYANPGGWSCRINKNHVHEKLCSEPLCITCGAEL